jgi:ABC-type transporter Mla maintaining outer membrane lipid asymmetry ATPase subunit MlaF
MKRKSIQSLEFDAMSFAYENSPLIFDNISIALPKAKAVWVRSPGGRGKSTLLKILAGLLTPQSGRYLINGEAANEMSFEEFLSYRLNIGYGFDMGGLLNNKTVSENLILPLLYHNMVESEEAVERVEQVIELFGMQTIKDQRPFAVPGSQRKLSCVARAFIHHPQVVFLDDPQTGLKQDNLNDLFHYVEESFGHRGLKQVFFTSERAEFAQRFDAEELLISEDWFTARSVA